MGVPSQDNTFPKKAEIKLNQILTVTNSPKYLSAMLSQTNFCSRNFQPFAPTRLASPS